MFQRFLVAAAAALSILAPQAGHAGAFPERPIRIVVPYPAGGSSDVLIRVMAPVLQGRWGVPVVVENRVGASTIIGVNAVAKAAPDGYTLGVVTNAFAVNPSLRDNLPYDTLKDFAPLTQLTFTPNVLVAQPGASFKTLRGLQELARSGKRELSSGSIGNGTAAHLALEKLKALSGMNILHVPYPGSAPGVVAVMGGQTDLLMAPLPDVLPYVRSGKIVALGVGSASRVPQLPEVATFIESGFTGFESGAWFGMVGPAGLDPQIAQKLSADLASALADPAVHDKIAALGLTPTSSTPEAFRKLIAAEVKSSGEIVRRAGIRVD
ncbi:tripartite tricarboxylate transporter substrate binding protein [Xylophilus rhododendri]|uniref:Tripartite tricarboxylate transporter substrate binding protein n=1 Tax=Xylophilus rhododendri TaxID=2697032 RepID=A0A857J7T5_9BURK|nr:tripartite tricarboxylate transporter substrate binding protein [Xylophilus rhododendri]QHI99131.1 tripartite tricarboxylate transporter substrate binding protein [Xylophilus rhododendri]